MTEKAQKQHRSFPKLSSESGPVIRIVDLHRTYKQGDLEVHALQGVNLEIQRGEFTSLAGASGSGKSTLLNMIGCLDRPSSGEVFINGSSTAKGSIATKSGAAKFRLENIGFIFQAYNLIPVFNAYENAEFTLMLQGVPKEKRRSIVEPLLERVGLKDLMKRRPHELSGGQQQRVAVVRAIAPHPSIVLADEPTANLDSETSRGLLELMLELNREHHTTFLFSSHDPIVIELARRVIRLKDGRIDQDTNNNAQDRIKGKKEGEQGGKNQR